MENYQNKTHFCQKLFYYLYIQQSRGKLYRSTATTKVFVSIDSIFNMDNKTCLFRFSVMKVLGLAQLQLIANKFQNNKSYFENKSVAQITI